MTEGERIKALEVRFEHLTEVQRELAAETSKLAVEVAKLNDVLSQAKGARWLLGLMIAGAGFLLGKFSGFIAFAGK